MPPRKGMSRDDKLTTMQTMMMESKDVWTLKELEKACPKRGIIVQAVKDVLQELVDNDMVSFDKIGSSNFYWCFPSEAYNRRTVAVGKLAESVRELEAEAASMETEIKEMQFGRDASEERAALDREIAEYDLELRDVQRSVDKYETLNPEAIREAEKHAELALVAANRWTDNIFTIKSWCTKHFAIESSTFDKQFDLAENFDYV